jgi:[ribosomal protein S18]-alanine N-acetyltransferase
MREAFRRTMSGPMPETVKIRGMLTSDIARIGEIEKECFTTPWTEEAFYNELMHNHFAHYVVMEWNDLIIGYAGLWTILDEAHVTNIAIIEAYRGRKLGDRLMMELMSLAMVRGMKRITLEVRVSNTVAQRLYEKYGFYPEGVRRGYYSDNGEDAIIMWADLPSPDIDL